MIVRFAGFGGQGIVLSSYIIGQSAAFDGKKALQNQSYGSESRGGECRGDVIISGEQINELEPTQYDVLVVMAQPAYDKFIPMLKPGGILHLATDWQPYADHMLEVLQASPDFINLSPTDDYCETPEWRPYTKYEARGERLGHDVRDLLFERT